jgi:uncharacterized SAM-binding protein YcdF (DUF218 family)
VKPASQKIFGCFTRRERWGLSPRGWLAAVLICIFASVLWLLNIQPFLAKTKRVDTKILVVEGWVHEFVIRAAVVEFQTGHYDKIYTTGGPVAGSGHYINDYNTSASVGAELLIANGMPHDKVQMTPSRISGRDRTYSSALALRDWLREHKIEVQNFNVVTEDVHARRTQLLFQEAFGKSVKVGIIAVPDPDYDPKHWWNYSEGVREILGESVAYIYAKFIFWPTNSNHQAS